MSEDAEVRRKRLLFRSWHRGMREVDLLLGPFAESALASLTPRQLGEYEALLEESDASLYEWITGRAPPPPERDGEVLRLLMTFRFRPRPA